MCELFFITKSNNTRISESLARKIVDMALLGAEKNRDGFGVFTDTKHYKKGIQFRKKHAKKVVKIITGSQYAVIHVRKATNGKVNDQNAHPFFYKHYLLSHNGIVHTTERSHAVDTMNMLKQIVDTKEREIPAKIKNAIKEVSGYFSCFLRTPDKRLFYFKDYSAEFYFAYFPKKHLIVGMTDKDKIDLLFSKKVMIFQMNQEKYVIREAPENTIFEVGNHTIIPLEKFTKSCWSNYSGWNSYIDKEKIKKAKKILADGKEKVKQKKEKVKEVTTDIGNYEIFREIVDLAWDKKTSNFIAEVEIRDSYNFLIDSYSRKLLPYEDLHKRTRGFIDDRGSCWWWNEYKKCFEQAEDYDFYDTGDYV